MLEHIFGIVYLAFYACLTKFKKKSIFLDRISHQFLVTVKRLIGWNISIDYLELVPAKIRIWNCIELCNQTVLVDCVNWSLLQQNDKKVWEETRLAWTTMVSTSFVCRTNGIRSKDVEPYDETFNHLLASKPSQHLISFFFMMQSSKMISRNFD